MPFGCHFELIFHGFICFLHTLLELHICIDFAWNFHEFRSLKFQCPIKYNPFECPIDLGEALFPSFTASTETASAISAGSMVDAYTTLVFDVDSISSIDVENSGTGTDDSHDLAELLQRIRF